MQVARLDRIEHPENALNPAADEQDGQDLPPRLRAQQGSKLGTSPSTRATGGAAAAVGAHSAVFLLWSGVERWRRLAAAHSHQV